MVDKKVVGTCNGFCPLKELQLRKKERLLNKFETGEGLLPIKEYSFFSFFFISIHSFIDKLNILRGTLNRQINCGKSSVSSVKVLCGDITKTKPPGLTSTR